MVFLHFPEKITFMETVGIILLSAGIVLLLSGLFFFKDKDKNRVGR
jgi:hypothetical protein